MQPDIKIVIKLARELVEANSHYGPTAKHRYDILKPKFDALEEALKALPKPTDE